MAALTRGSRAASECPDCVVAGRSVSPLPASARRGCDGQSHARFARGIGKTRLRIAAGAARFRLLSCLCFSSVITVDCSRDYLVITRASPVVAPLALAVTRYMPGDIACVGIVRLVVSLVVSTVASCTTSPVIATTRMRTDP